MSNALLLAWEKTVRRRGPDRAVTDAASGRSATFRELDAGARRWLAIHAPAPDALSGRAVVFAAPNGIGWLEIFLGLLRAGALAVPVDAAEPRAAQRDTAEALRAGFWWDGGRLVALAQARRWRDPAACLIKLTSGTTGLPRPLVFSAAQLLADARQVCATMGIGPRDVNYALIPLGHSYGLGNLTIPLLARGVPFVCGSAPWPHAIAADFARWRPTVFPGVPNLWQALATTDVALESLRLGISAGAPLPPDAAREFSARHSRRLHGFYGSSETGGIAYDRTGRATLAGGVGRALRGVTLTARPGARLLVGSAAVFTHGNRHRRGRHGTWLMADRVALAPNGDTTLLGRRGLTVKVAGRRVNLAEIALRLRRLPGVSEVWTALTPGNPGVLGAVVVSARPAGALRAELHADTAAWKIPKKWAVVPVLPTNARGKPDRPALLALLA